jgi:hypothetical protein
MVSLLRALWPLVLLALPGFHYSFHFHDPADLQKVR